MEIIAFITSIRETNEEYIASGITQSGRVIITTKEYVKPGSIISLTGSLTKTKEIPEIEAESSRILSGKEAEKEKKKIDRLIERNCKLERKDLVFFSDKVMKQLNPQINQAAKMIKRAIFLHRPIIIRYHADTDGMCSALAIYFAIEGVRNLNVHMNRYPFYRELDASSDIHTISALDTEYLPPLLLILDLGSNDQNISSYRKVKEKGFQILIVDHHPVDKEVVEEVDLLVSPYLTGGGSDYATGLLSSEIAKRISDIDLHELPLIALTGDRSKLQITRGKKHLKYSIVFDFIASAKSYTIEELANTFLDKETMSVFYTETMDRLEQVKKRILKKVKKKQIGEVKIFLIDTDKEFEEGKFPGRGEMASIIQDEFATDSSIPTITIGHGKRIINLRLNLAAVKRGITGMDLAEAIEKGIPNAVIGGGGHPVAAAIRINKGFENIVVDHLLKEIEKKAKKK